jgi:alkanesulfonate monooxygenase SsuD/methylene tetrahydromethanopterin reductase-like flavin-dependent oxidoreductase (luciferase family)
VVPVTKKGRLFNAVEVDPRPIPSPPPPIWIGGGSDQAAERAAKYGDCWNPVYFPAVESNRVISGAGVYSIPELQAKIERVKSRREELGRSGTFDFACSAPFFPAEKTRDAVDKFLHALHDLQAAGLSWFNVGLPTESKAVYFENLAWLNQEVLPRFP